MKNENIIIALIFLAIVALFAFNFNKLTGLTTIEEKDDYAPTINIYKTTFPKTEIRAGDKINIDIKINKGCVNPSLEFYPLRINWKGEKIVGTRKAVKEFNPGIDDCARPSTEGAKIHCAGFKYCQGDLKEDLIKEIFKTHSDWDGNYMVRVFYYDEDRKEQFIDSKEFKIIS